MPTPEPPSYFALTRDEQNELLQGAANRMPWSTKMLEKDVWVVWTLDPDHPTYSRASTPSNPASRRTNARSARIGRAPNSPNTAGPPSRWKTVSGELRSQLEEDYGEMIAASMFVQPPPTFETIAARLAELEGRLNAHLEASPVTI